MKNTKIKVGDLVGWSGTWNTDPIKNVKVLEIYKDVVSRTDNGVRTNIVDYTDKNTCVFILDNGHWCYGYQIHYVIGNLK